MTPPGMIEQISPSAFVRLQRCGLAEYRRRTHRGGSPPSTPSGRLGNAAHRVLAWVAENAQELAADQTVEAKVRERWLAEVDREERDAAAHRFEASHGPARTWPRYSLIEAGLAIDGPALAIELCSLPPDRRLVEHDLRASDGSIAGTADLIIVGEKSECSIIDHKAGSVASADLEPGGKYRAQLLLYAIMASDMGLRPVAVELRPLGGRPIAMGIPAELIASVGAEARDAMESYNRAVIDNDPLSLATPSEKSCEWCPYLIDCPAVWGAASPDLGDLKVVEGVVTLIQQTHSSIALRLDSAGGQVEISGIPLDSLSGQLVGEGHLVRAVGLREVRAGSFRARRGQCSVDVLRAAPGSVHPSGPQ